MANYHVVPNPEKGWAVKRERAKRTSDFARTQISAERKAKKFAVRSGGGEVVIHRRDGKIREKDTMYPARDPFPPRG